MTVPADCQAIADELEVALRSLEQLRPPPGLGREVAVLPGLRDAAGAEAKIRQLAGELDACRQTHGAEPAERSTFAGTALLSSSGGSGTGDFSLALEFLEPGRSHVLTQSLPPFRVVIAGYTLTISQTGGGHGRLDRTDGELELRLELRVEAPAPGGHLDLPIALSSRDAHGSPLDAQGRLAIAGAGIGRGHGPAFPARAEVAIVARGTIAPHP